MIIAIDGGTTNTRLSLVSDGKVSGRIKLRVGARNGRDELSAAVKEGISELLRQNSLSERDIRLAALSGMIGSESGLCNIPHITAPAGADELSCAVVNKKLPEITSIPTFFIPGIKTFSDPEAEPLDSLDIMRGEETELVGLLSQPCMDGKLTVLLPGSHMKIVEVENRRIIAFRTSISGELSRAAAENTILKQSIGDAFPKLADAGYLRRGFEYAELHGINEALFKVRVQANFNGRATGEQLYSFLLGAILRDDVRSIGESKGRVVIAGSEPFRSALGALLGDVMLVPDEIADNAAAIGAELITAKI